MSSNNRKILVAARRTNRGNAPRKGPPTTTSACSLPKNNANNRLTLLRNRLKEEAELSNTQPTPSAQNNQSTNNNFSRKRQYEEIGVHQVQVTHSACKIARNQGADENFYSKQQCCSVSRGASQIGDEMEWTLTVEDQSNSQEENVLFIVIDTNIFISNLELLKNILQVEENNKKIILYIPWMVSEELDYMKIDYKNRSRNKAQEAIKFLERGLSNNNKKIRGQSMREYNDQISTNKSQDNKIIACCLQLLENQRKIILLTNDINMKNKAHLNSIPVCSHAEIMSRVCTKPKPPLKKTDFILNKMTNVCSQIIKECSAKAYGEEVVKHMEAFKTPPRNLQACIQIFQKYWFTIFEDLIMKQFRKTIEEVSVLLNNTNNLENNDNQFGQFLHLCNKMCVYLKDIDNCKYLVDGAIADLNNIRFTVGRLSIGWQQRHFRNPTNHKHSQVTINLVLFCLQCLSLHFRQKQFAIFLFF